MLDDAHDRSTYFVDAEFTDEDGNLTVPTSLKFSLLDGYGEIVNGHDEDVLTPATSVSVCLSGSDLVFSGNAIADQRRALFIGEYTSGVGVKPIRQCSLFSVVSACS